MSLVKTERYAGLQHYTSLSTWWKAHDWPVMPPESLSQYGLVIPGVAAGFLYKTDSNIAWLEFLISNPEVNKEARSKGLDAIIEGLSAEAKRLGFKTVFTSSYHPGLIKRYEKHQFVKTDENVTQLVRILGDR